MPVSDSPECSLQHTVGYQSIEHTSYFDAAIQLRATIQAEYNEILNYAIGTVIFETLESAF